MIPPTAATNGGGRAGVGAGSPGHAFLTGWRPFRRRNGRCGKPVQEGILMSEPSPARILSEEILSAAWGRLTRYTLDYTRSDGGHDTQIREIYDHGNGSAVLPLDALRGTVLLVRQFRLAAHLQGGSGLMIEVCAGLNEGLAPEQAVRKEAEEELGCHVHDLRHRLDVFMSAGSLSEKLSLFTARYAPADRFSAGGGAAGEGEDIEVLEMQLDDALVMVKNGEIVDAKTVILLQLAERDRLLGG
jgi:nudix-type nucleoside diphosphatase (YffH/AdpP family)